MLVVGPPLLLFHPPMPRSVCMHFSLPIFYSNQYIIMKLKNVTRLRIENMFEFEHNHNNRERTKKAYNVYYR